MVNYHKCLYGVDVADTSIAKLAVGLQLKGFLVGIKMPLLCDHLHILSGYPFRYQHLFDKNCCCQNTVSEYLWVSFTLSIYSTLARAFSSGSRCGYNTTC